MDIIFELVAPLSHALGTHGTQLILSWDLSVPYHTSYQCQHRPHVGHFPAVLHRHPQTSTKSGRSFRLLTHLNTIPTLGTHLRFQVP